MIIQKLTSPFNCSIHDGLRLAPTRTGVRDGAAAPARVQQLERRLAGLLGVGESPAVHRLAVGGRHVGRRRVRHQAGAEERHTVPAAVRRRGLPAGHTQHRLQVCGLQYGRQDHQ